MEPDVPDSLTCRVAEKPANRVSKADQHPKQVLPIAQTRSDGASLAIWSRPFCLICSLYAHNMLMGTSWTYVTITLHICAFGCAVRFSFQHKAGNALRAEIKTPSGFILIRWPSVSCGYSKRMQNLRVSSSMTKLYLRAVHEALANRDRYIEAVVHRLLQGHLVA